MRYLSDIAAEQEAINHRALAIRAVITDIDGVLTDGRFGYTATDEVKFFHALDGQGFVLLKELGFVTGVISGKSSEANRRRARDLRFDFCREGVRDKLAVFNQIVAEYRLTAAECLYIGDDLPDIPVLCRAGIGVAVATAAPALDAVASLKTERAGGDGAVRETIDWLLQRQGKLQQIIAALISPRGSNVE